MIVHRLHLIGNLISLLMIIFVNSVKLHVNFSISSLSSNNSCRPLSKHELELKPKVQVGEKDFVFKFYNSSVLSCIEYCCHSHKCYKVYFTDEFCFGVQFEYPLFAPHSSYDLSRLPARRRIKREVADQNIEFSPKKCEYGVDKCPPNEFCELSNNRRRVGTCKCNVGYIRNPGGNCTRSMDDTTDLMLSTPPVNEDTSYMSQELSSISISATTSKPTTISEPPIEKLVVSINNKTVELKEGTTEYKSATLSAYAIGDQGTGYTFKWTLLDKPASEDDGSISDMNSQTISLTNLIAGIYIFKVEVTGKFAYGEATGNITVIPKRHRNMAPVAVIVPPNQQVTLPNSAVILDGSGSTDDGEIVSYHWDLITGPIGYKLLEDDGKTLQLKNLIPGKFTIMLKVKDDAGLEGNATSVVIAVKETDYPPTANAGGDKIIYLPQSETTLNGNASSDDHGIVEWEWTKGPEDSGNAVDMQDTRTPYLHLSNLEEGHYHFILKVVDTAQQTANSTAHVYVHSSADNTPQANAGKNTTLIIPITNTLLDGSESTGVSPESHFLWTQISGPTTAKILSPNQIKTNISDLTRGDYLFNLTVWNGQNTLVNSSSSVWIIVKQEKNGVPIAKAGTDFSVTLPVSVVIVNGSDSTDDIKITKWHWERDATSLAAGNVIKNSDHSPVLLFTDVVPGRYVWTLTVWDDQGATSNDTVSIIVKNGPHHMDEVEVVLGIGIGSFSAGQLSNLIQKFELLLHSTSSDVSIEINNILGRPMSGETTLRLLGSTSGEVMRGRLLAQQLQAKTMMSSNDKILDIPIIDVYTVVCQNNCSGHGECVQSTRKCRCHSWWMGSLFRKHFGDGISNCDWSVIYLFVGIFGSTLALGILIWFFAWLSKKIYDHSFPATKRKKMPHYSLLDTHEMSKVKARSPGSLLDSGSETDSDHDVLFDSRKQKLLKSDKIKNGHIKLQRLRT